MERGKGERHAGTPEQRILNALLVPRDQAQHIRALLEKKNLWDDQFCLSKENDSHFVAIPIKTDCVKDVQEVLPQFTVAVRSLPLSKRAKAKLSSPAQVLNREISALCKQNDVCLESIINEVPSKWERHGDLVLLPSSAFQSESWRLLGDNLWSTVAKALQCKKLARASAIANDDFRSSGVQLLLGNSGMVTHVDNGIRYTYDVTKCMFSSGNITEKLRISSWNCSGEIVVDLFAGIGYFTLPYLVHAGAAHVHACEWNPSAVTALRNNLSLNGVSYKCTVHEGDNRQLELSGVADRVNLGLIPSSEQSWAVAVKVLKPSGGFLHVHGNITTDNPQCRHVGHDLKGSSSLQQSDHNEHSSDTHSLPCNGGRSLHSDAACNLNVHNIDLQVDGSHKDSETCNLLCKCKGSDYSDATGNLVPNSGSVNKCGFKVCFNESKHISFSQSICVKEGENNSEGCCCCVSSSQNGTDSQEMLSGPGICVQESENTSNECQSKVMTLVQENDSQYNRNSLAKAQICDCDNENGCIFKPDCDYKFCGENTVPHNSTPEQIGVRLSKKEVFQASCKQWSNNVSERIAQLLREKKGGDWIVDQHHLELVKSYAPHLTHAVLDLHCYPKQLKES